MSERVFQELLASKWDEGKFLCVGLDSEYEKIPSHLRSLGVEEGIVAFNVAIIEATKNFAAAYKPNMAFYEAYGAEGLCALEATMDEIRALAPDVPVIIDAKRADIGNTNAGYVCAIFDELGADAVTLHPYLGAEALAPFLSRKEKGCIVLCRTSNPGAGELQDLRVEGRPLYMHVAQTVAEKWNTHGNCGLVVGATYPQEMREIRRIAPDMPFLIPGIGAQGGDLEASVKAGQDARGGGLIMAASRSILFASSGEDFAEAAERSAQTLHDSIQKAL